MASPSSLSSFPALKVPNFGNPRKGQRHLKQRRTWSPMKALKEWREYEDAVREKDLGRALRFLQNLETSPSSSSPFESSSSASSPIRMVYYAREGFMQERDWEVLDTCLNADDMRLVASAYAFLQNRGLLSNFGKCKNIVVDSDRNVTPMRLKEFTGLEASKLSSKKWGVSGSSRFMLIGFLGGASYLLYQGIEIRPNLAVILGLGILDAAFLGGSCLAQLMCLWPPYRRRVLVHEAGHLLAAYLMGCPIRGVILDPFVALQMGIQGQAGTQFWDQKLENELAEGRLSRTSFDRYSTVLFAGIAAEALVYGEVEGGENDENLFRNICLLLQPPLKVSEMANQARWSVLQSYNLLKWHRAAHMAAVKALESGHGLGVIIRRIEEAVPSCR